VLWCGRSSLRLGKREGDIKFASRESDWDLQIAQPFFGSGLQSFAPEENAAALRSL
jgi:hypothetical protein